MADGEAPPEGCTSHTDCDTHRCLYFAFGSNLSSWRIKINVPSAKLHGVARLDGYDLQFRSIFREPFASVWKGATATIEAKEGEAVWGVVWSMDKEQVPALDRQELCYNPLEVTVLKNDGETLRCRTYAQASKPPFDPSVDRPSPQYLQCIIDGAKEYNLPKSYVAELEKVQHNDYSGEVEVKRQQVKKP